MRTKRKVLRGKFVGGRAPRDAHEKRSLSGAADCDARFDGFTCTLLSGHRGDHVAGGVDKVYVRWAP